MTRFLTAFLVWGLLALPASANPGPSPADSVTYQFDNEASTMTVYGTSNVRDWTMDVTQIDGSVALDTASDELPSIREIRVTVPVEHMVSEKDRLQRHAHEALEKEDYPTITFTASDVQVAAADADSFSVTANGDLTISGDTHAIELTAKGFQQEDGTLTVRGEQKLKLSTFDVERPSLMFGAIKVDDGIRIGFDVALAPSSGTTTASE
jgi:polyisoprenoid-binding protein YceI